MTNQIPTDTVELEAVTRANLIQKYEALQRLKENKDFQVLILDGYLKESAVDKVSLLASDYVRKNNLRGIIMEELVAISALEGYFDMVANLGAPVDEEEDDEDEAA